jgi:hypothetical protein
LCLKHYPLLEVLQRFPTRRAYFAHLVAELSDDQFDAIFDDEDVVDDAGVASTATAPANAVDVAGDSRIAGDAPAAGVPTGFGLPSLSGLSEPERMRRMIAALEQFEGPIAGPRTARCVSLVRYDGVTDHVLVTAGRVDEGAGAEDLVAMGLGTNHNL